MKALPDFGADVPGHRNTIFQREAINRDKGNDIGRPHARVRSLMPGEVDQLGGLPCPANRRFLNGFSLAGQRDDAAVVIGIHLPVEEVDAGNHHGFDDGVDFGGVAAFREIGNAFNKSVGHGRKDNKCGLIRQLGCQNAQRRSSIGSML